MRDYVGMLVIHGDLYQFCETKEKIKLLDSNYTHDLTWELEFKSGFSGRYDPKWKAFHHHTADLTEYDLFWWPEIFFPNDFINDNEPLTAEKIRSYNERFKECDCGFYIVDQDFSLRINGIKPDIILDGIKYVLNVRDREFYQENDPTKKFLLNEVLFNEPAILYYNATLKEPVTNKEQLSQIGQYVCLQFPPLEQFDPLWHCNKKELAVNLPLQYNIQAKSNDVKILRTWTNKASKKIHSNRTKVKALVKENTAVRKKSNKKYKIS